MSTYLKQYHAKRADIALAAARIVHWLQYETNRQSKTPIADLMTHYSEDNLHLYGSVARSLFGSGIIDDPKLTRKQNGDWWENGSQIGIADGLIAIEGRAHYGRK